jgi:hypothetical protein
MFEDESIFDVIHVKGSQEKHPQIINPFVDDNTSNNKDT